MKQELQEREQRRTLQETQAIDKLRENWTQTLTAVKKEIPNQPAAESAQPAASAQAPADPPKPDLLEGGVNMDPVQETKSKDTALEQLEPAMKPAAAEPSKTPAESAQPAASAQAPVDPPKPNLREGGVNMDPVQETKPKDTALEQPEAAMKTAAAEPSATPAEPAQPAASTQAPADPTKPDLLEGGVNMDPAQETKPKDTALEQPEAAIKPAAAEPSATPAESAQPANQPATAEPSTTPADPAQPAASTQAPADPTKPDLLEGGVNMNPVQETKSKDTALEQPEAAIKPAAAEPSATPAESAQPANQPAAAEPSKTPAEPAQPAASAQAPADPTKPVLREGGVNMDPVQETKPKDTALEQLEPAMKPAAAEPSKTPAESAQPAASAQAPADPPKPDLLEGGVNMDPVQETKSKDTALEHPEAANQPATAEPSTTPADPAQSAASAQAPADPPKPNLVVSTWTLSRRQSPKTQLWNNRKQQCSQQQLSQAQHQQNPHNQRQPTHPKQQPQQNSMLLVYLHLLVPG